MQLSKLTGKPVYIPEAVRLAEGRGRFNKCIVVGVNPGLTGNALSRLQMHLQLYHQITYFIDSVFLHYEVQLRVEMFADLSSNSCPSIVTSTALKNEMK